MFLQYCSYLLPDKSKSSKQKTPVVKRSRHPKWYYTMIYEDLSVDELKERSLELTVWDHDKITSNEFMGGIRLNLGSGKIVSTFFFLSLSNIFHFLFKKFTKFGNILDFLLQNLNRTA